MKKIKNNLIFANYSLPIGIILILSFSRLIPHPPNFTPVIAVAIMSTYFFKNIYISLATLLISMILADLYIVHDVIFTLDGVSGTLSASS